MWATGGGEGVDSRPGGDKCYCEVNVKHLSISGVEGKEIKRIDRQRESSAQDEKGKNQTKVHGGGSIWQQLEKKSR